jgi:hypothetical protein
VKLRKCSKCQKEISFGKFYSFYSGKKGGKRKYRYRVYEKNKDNFFCPVCASEEKANPPENIGFNNFLEIEWEVGNQTDEQILDFQEKWNKHYHYENNQFVKEDQNTDEKTILTWCQTARQELEPFLQKPEIVEKSFGGKIESHGKAAVWFYYLFAKSAQEENYRKKVVEPTIAKILGVEKLNQEINTSIKDNGPGVPGLADGKLKIGDKIVNYQWIDGPQGGFFRRLFFEVFDPQFALQSFCRALEIKIKELGGKIPEPNQQNDNNQNDLPNPPQPSKPDDSNGKKDKNNYSTNQSDKSNYVLWVSLGIGGILLIGLIIWIFAKKKKTFLVDKKMVRLEFILRKIS